MGNGAHFIPIRIHLRIYLEIDKQATQRSWRFQFIKRIVIRRSKLIAVCDQYDYNQKDIIQNDDSYISGYDNII